jgi:exosortase/archaeosortase
MENEKALNGPLGGTSSAVTQLRGKAFETLVSTPAVSAILRTTGQIKAIPCPLTLQLLAFGISVTVLTVALFAFKAVNTAQNISGLSGGRLG